VSELDPDVRAFLERTRGAGVPSPSERERVRRRLLAAGAATTVAAGAQTAAAFTSTVAVKIMVSVVVASVAIGVPVVYHSVLSPPAPRVGARTSASSLVGSVEESDPTQEPRTPEPIEVLAELPTAPDVQQVRSTTTRVVARPAAPTPRGEPASRGVGEAATAEAATVETATVETATVETATVEAATVQVAEEEEVEPTRPALVEDTLAEEISLLARSVRALNNGSFEEARAGLDEHTSRFPDSQLRREREAMVARLEEAR